MKASLFYCKKIERGIYLNGYFEIGKIAGTHGIKGTLRIFPTTEEPSRFDKLKELLVEHHGQKTTYHIQSVSHHKQFVLVTVKEITDINEAERLKGATILIAEKDALPLKEDEYYTRDLYGLSVYTEEGEYLGVLDDVYVTGANDVYSVKKPQQKELLIPAIKQCIKKVDLAEKKMIVALLEGLREE